MLTNAVFELVLQRFYHATNRNL